MNIDRWIETNIYIYIYDKFLKFNALGKFGIFYVRGFSKVTIFEMEKIKVTNINNLTLSHLNKMFLLV